MIDKKLLFIWIPKCAGSSINRTFNLNYQVANNDFKYNFDNSSNVTFGHADINLLLENNILSKKFYNDSFKFCVVRNPFDRCISLYHYLKEMGSNCGPGQRSFKEFIKILYECEIPKNSLSNVTEIGLLNNQWNEMVSWIPDDIDKIFRFENLQEINDFFGIKMVNSNKSSHKDYQYYYDNDSKRMVEIVYKNDLNRFGYEY